MPQSSDSTRSIAASYHDGSDLKLTFACPDCGAEGWVFWGQLPRGMRCHACGSRFWIGAAGRLNSDRQARKIRMHCPRCRKVEAVSEVLAARNLSCNACGLSLSLQTSGEQRGAAEPALGSKSSLRSVSRQAKERRFDFLSVRARLPWVLGLMLAAVFLLTMLAMGWVPCSGRPSFESTATEFTRNCANGKTELAVANIPADQRQQFRRWMAICYQDTGSQTRSTGNRRNEPAIAVHVLNQSADRAVLCVILSSESSGTVAQTQHWLFADGKWWFDASTTLGRLSASE